MAARMSIGLMNERVAIQSPTETADELGQAQQSWTTNATVWAQVVATGGTEFVTDGQVRATVSHRVTVRRMAATLAITPAMRLLVVTQSNKVLNVVAVTPVDGGREFLAVLCTEPV